MVWRAKDGLPSEAARGRAAPLSSDAGGQQPALTLSLGYAPRLTCSGGEHIDRTAAVRAATARRAVQDARPVRDQLALGVAPIRAVSLRAERIEQMECAGVIEFIGCAAAAFGSRAEDVSGGGPNNTHLRSSPVRAVCEG